ncbi:hypothetical protein CYY_001243 [Polysphondylium violaceum]|uniref:Uncharacterized protein n=1 Tax=Polysphondylium violaceum TaxID=133409 RepID=A0A8J4Q2D2_9MYCE|nr:hypothetical protein CYY_001243 [Polysphondylium violaceum]
MNSDIQKNNNSNNTSLLDTYDDNDNNDSVILHNRDDLVAKFSNTVQQEEQEEEEIPKIRGNYNEEDDYDEEEEDDEQDDDDYDYGYSDSDDEQDTSVLNYHVSQSALDDDVSPLYDRDQYDQKYSTNSQPPLVRQISFNPIKETFSFNKARFESDPNSYFSGHYNYDYDDEEEEDDEDEDYTREFNNSSSNDEEYNEDQEVIIKNNQTSSDDDDDGSFDEEDDFEERELVNQLRQSISDEEDEEEGFNSMEEHSDIENEKLDISTVSSNTGEMNNIYNTFQKQQPHLIQKPIDSPPLSPIKSPLSSDGNTNASNGLRSFANRATVFVPRYINKQQQQQQQQQKEETEEEEEEEEEEETEEEEEEEMNPEEITTTEELSGSDVDNQEILKIINNRSTLENSLMETRAKAALEKDKLYEFFDKAQIDLRKCMDDVSTYFNLDLGDDISIPPTLANLSLLRNDSEVSDSLILLENKINEIEESIDKPSKSKGGKGKSPSKVKVHSLLHDFIHLKQQIEKENSEKINRDNELRDITHHLLTMASQLSKAVAHKMSMENSPIMNNKNNNNNSSNSNNSTASTNVSSELISSPITSSFTTTSIDIPNNNNRLNHPSIELLSSTSSFSPSSSPSSSTMEKEIEFYRFQIKNLEERLSKWKFDNEMLHLEILNDKQSNTKEMSNLVEKMKKIEMERDEISKKNMDLLESIGELEVRETVMTNRMQIYRNDNEALSRNVIELQIDRNSITEKFNQLILEIREMGENTISNLKDVINQLVFEREELESSVFEAQSVRDTLIKELNQVTTMASNSEVEKKIINDKLKSSEEFSKGLLLSCQNTFKQLEETEIKCNHYKNQLLIVNKRLVWTESEIDRLTKEMDSLSKLNSRYQQQQQFEDSLNTDYSNSNNNTNATMDSSHFETIKNEAINIKNLLDNEKNQLVKLDSNITLILEKGKVNSFKTLETLKDFVIKELNITKSDLSSKISEIDSLKSSIDNNDSLVDGEVGDSDKQKQLLEEMEIQKSKLFEMQQKILKMESKMSQINSVDSSSCSPSTDISNSYDRNQIAQLKRLENKIRKIEAGISEIVDYKSQPPTPILTTTTITTTTTHHTYTNNNIINDQNNNPSSDFILNGTTNDGNYSTNLKGEIMTPSTSSTNLVDDYNEQSSGGNISVSLSTKGEDSIGSNETPMGSDTMTNNINSNDNNGQVSLIIKSILTNSVSLFTKSTLSIMYYKLFTSLQSTTTATTNNEQILSIFKSSCKFGLFVAGGFGLFKLLSMPKILQQKQSKQNNNNNSNIKKEYIINGLVGASVLGGILFLKQRNSSPLIPLAGGLIGMVNGILLVEE